MQASDLRLAANSRPVLSLQKLALIKVTTTLCNHRQLLPLINECVLFENLNTELIPISKEAWTPVRDMAEELLTDICISVGLKEEIMELLWPLSYKILMWRSLFAHDYISKYFYWTDRGRIDSKRTIQRMLKEKKIPGLGRFFLACKVCLYKEIQDIWTHLTLLDKTLSIKKNNCPHILIWAHAMTGTRNAFHVYLKDALRCAIRSGFTDTIQYLFNMLSTDAKGGMAVYCIKEFVENKLFHFEKSFRVHLTEDEIDMACFLYFYMSDEYQKIYLENPMLVGTLLLYSSDENYFLNFFETEILERLSLDDQKDATASFLFILFRAYHYEVITDFDPRELFINVWKMLPDLLKSKLRQTSLGRSIANAFLKDNLSFASELGKDFLINDIISAARKSRISGSPFGYRPGNFSFLTFLLEENLVT